MKKVLIIIVSYNGERWIDRCLGSALRYGNGADVLLIDNASQDGTLELVPEEVKVIRSPKNLGFGAANNIGFRYAIEHGYDYVYLLNQDAYLEKGTLEKMLEVHAWNPQYGILSPVQTNADGNIDQQFRKRTGINAKSGIDVPVDAGFVMAAHWLMPVSAIRKVGAFSPTFHHYGEDDNLIDRINFHGYKVGIITSVSAIHDRGQRTDSKEQRCIRKCLIPVIRMSNPGKDSWSFLRSVLWLAGCSIKNFSLIPIKSVPALFSRRKEIRLNRELSKMEGAFLTAES